MSHRQTLHAQNVLLSVLYSLKQAPTRALTALCNTSVPLLRFVNLQAGSLTLVCYRAQEITDLHAAPQSTQIKPPNLGMEGRGSRDNTRCLGQKACIYQKWCSFNNEPQDLPEIKDGKLAQVVLLLPALCVMLRLRSGVQQRNKADTFLEW